MSNHDNVLGMAVALLKEQSPSRSQTDIARELDIELSKVNRCFTAVKESQWAIETVVINRGSCEVEALIDEAQKSYLDWSALRKLVQEQSPNLQLHVIHVDHHESPAEFGRAAAVVVKPLLHGVTHVGVTWGRTLASVFDGLQSSANHNRQSKEKKGREKVEKVILPLCGEPLHLQKLDNDARYSSSNLAVILQKALMGEQDTEQPTLYRLPAFLPENHNNSQVRDFIYDISGFTKIFGRHPQRKLNWQSNSEAALVNQLEVILTGAGVVHSDVKLTGSFLRERCESGEVDFDRLKKLVVGDIGGVLLAHESASDAERAAVDKLNAGWCGLSENLLTYVAKKSTAAREKLKAGEKVNAEQKTNADKKAKPAVPPPGTVVIARGAEKAEVVRVAVKRGLISTLIIGVDLARALEIQLEVITRSNK